MAWVYVIKNSEGRFYIGMRTDLEERLLIADSIGQLVSVRFGLAFGGRNRIAMLVANWTKPNRRAMASEG